MEIIEEKHLFYLTIEFFRTDQSLSYRLEFLRGMPCEEITEQIVSSCIARIVKHRKIFKRKNWFSFSKKIDIKIKLKELSCQFSSIRNGELVMITFPSNNDDKNLFELKLENTKKTLYLILHSLLKSINSNYIDYKIQKKGFEVLLNKNPVIKDLSDYEKYQIIRCLKESEPRRLAQLYEENRYSFTEENKVLTDKYILKLKNKFGDDFLKHLIEIPKKPFEIKTVNRLTEVMKNSNGQIITLSFDGVNNFDFEIKNDRINLKKQGNQIGSYLKSGDLIFSNKSNKDRYMTATLMLYYANDSNGELLFFGQKTGCCSFCKKPLTDPISIYWGYGKTCAYANDLIWS